MMTDQWYIKTATGKRGPYSTDELQRYVDAGAIRPNVGIGDGEGRWMAAAAIDGLSFPKDALAQFKESVRKVRSERTPSEMHPTESGMIRRADQSDSERIEKEMDERRGELERTERELDSRGELLDQRAGELDRLEQRLEEREQRLEVNEKELDSRQSEIEAGASELEDRARQLTEREEGLDERQQLLDRRSADQEKEQSQQSDLQQELDSLKEQLVLVEQEKADAQEKLEGIEEREQTLVRREEESAAKIAEAENVKIEAAELSRREEEIEARSIELEERRAELESLEAELSRRSESFESREAELQERSDQLEGMDLELTRQREVMDELQQSAESNASVVAELDELRSSFVRVEADLDASEERLRDNEKELAEARAKLDEQSKQLEEQSDELSQKSEELRQRSAELDQRSEELQLRSIEIEAKQKEEQEASAGEVLTEKRKLLEEFADRQESLSRREAELIRREDELTKRELTFVEPSSSGENEEPEAQDAESSTTELEAEEVSPIESDVSEFVATPTEGPSASGDLPFEEDETPVEASELLPSTQAEHPMAEGQSGARDWQRSSHPQEMETAEFEAVPSIVASGGTRRSEVMEIRRPDSGSGVVTAFGSPQDSVRREGETVQSTTAMMRRLSSFRRENFEQRFGAIDEFFSDPDEHMKVDVSVHLPSGSRDFATMVTHGMSDYPIPMPNGQRSVRAELLLYVTHVDDLAVQVIRAAAKIPYRKKQGLSIGTTGELEHMELLRNSNQSDCVYMLPVIEADSKPIVAKEIIGGSIQLFWLVTITGAERKLIETNGIHRFLSLLEKNNHAVFFDLTRDCYVKRKGWFRR